MKAVGHVLAGAARWLGGTRLVMMGLGRHGVGNFDFALGVGTSA